MNAQEIFVQFDPDRQNSVATANAARIISLENAGRLTGPITSTVISFGVERPIRTVELPTPLSFGPLSINSFAARISDFGSVVGLEDADGDPNEVVVTANRSNKVKPINTFILGADALRSCSTLTFNKRRKVIEVSCR